ncbi:hypothetical protein [Streptomyces sp. Ncost-T10-10d]|uniref:hypothetical protein n=1 Tax=Streptomyces sp. Ncost-T10-10d TaxID=1839774 RepID=UPI002109A274|nr:hypothetical protein [Streptomyces sp. Ncost-T10-10d]
MARTAHHLPPSQTRKSYDDRVGSPWHCVVLNALRYSTRSLIEGASEGRRPRPQRVRRRVNVYCFPRHNRDRGVSRDSALAERRARQRLRAQAGIMLRLVNSPTGELACEAADMVDVPPANHQHSSIWLA